MTAPSREPLLPCPFCGGPVDLEQAESTSSRIYGKRQWWGVVCRNTMNRGGTCAVQIRPSASKEAAIARWNMRAAPAPSADAVHGPFESMDDLIADLKAPAAQPAEPREQCSWCGSPNEICADCGHKWDAAPAPSADQDQNGGQGHEAYVHCSLGALPLESGNAREATCLNTEPSARTGTDTQQGQLGANAGSIPAPPTSTPAAQPAEPSATDDLAEQLRRATIVIYGKCDESVLSAHKLMQKAADVIERQARDIAEARQLFNKEYNEHRESRRRLREELSGERDRHKRTAERAERAEAERDELRAARIAYASEFPTNTDGEPDTGSIHANIRALKAERDALREQLHLRTCERDEAQACITTSADTIAALRECVKAADEVRARFRVIGILPDDEAAISQFDAARAKVRT